MIRAPRGTALSCKGWQQEAALRMLMNNLDPEVAGKPEDLIVYRNVGTTRMSSRRPIRARMKSRTSIAGVQRRTPIWSSMQCYRG
jgi:hypothetical protein